MKLLTNRKMKIVQGRTWSNNNIKLYHLLSSYCHLLIHSVNSLYLPPAEHLI